MKFDYKTIRLVNAFRESLQQQTETIGEAESVAVLLWWTFVFDHAGAEGLDPCALAREQIEAFLVEAVPQFQIARSEH